MGILQLGNVSCTTGYIIHANGVRLVGFSFMFAPLLSDPPEWPLPDPTVEPGWYGEVWIKYPCGDCLFSSHFAEVLEARSRFRVIMNEACQIAYSPDSGMTPGKANKLHAQLRDWYDSLPGSLQPKSVVLPGHLQLQ